MNSSLVDKQKKSVKYMSPYEIAVDYVCIRRAIKYL